MKLLTVLLLIFLTISCSDSETVEPSTPDEAVLYFPPVDGTTWETSTPASLGWNESKLAELYAFLENNDTRAFILLKDGKIVSEKYWGKDLLQRFDFDANSQWYWASAGKSLTSVLTGIAQGKGLLYIDDATQDYLGTGWTSMPTGQESRISIRNQLSMNTGLDFTNGNLNCTEPGCLNYKSDPATEWYYYNAPYTLLHEVISIAGDASYNQLTDEWLENRIGMSGTWRELDQNNVYFSTARDAARFGLFNLARGLWEDQQILAEAYFSQMTQTSQNQNPSYGFLWWLNGKSETVFPSSTIAVNRPVTLNAPDDMFSALGKNGQIIDVVPSENLVLVRLGGNPDDAEIPIVIHDELWEILSRIIN